MKPNSSPLKLLDFALLKMDYEFIAPTVIKMPDEYYKEYELDLDFELIKNDALAIEMTVQINAGKNPLPGYRITAKVGSLFVMDKKAAITEEQRRSMEGFSTLYIALNNLRGMIASFTANGPMGKYILPSIDLNDLIQKKRQSGQTELTKEPEETKRKIVKQRLRMKKEKQI